MINHLEFSITINADNTQIWRALWEDKYYRDWAGVFFEGSYIVAENWEVGSKVHFLGPDTSGIYSIIETHIPKKVIQFKHIGTVLNGEEESINEESEKWSGATEIYSVIEKKDTNLLKIEIDVLDEHFEFMKTKFPEALEKIKSNCSI